MIYLFSASMIWAFSFGLIKSNLSTLDPVLVSSLRVFLSLAVFAPFLKTKKIDFRLKLKFMMIGAVQYGLMYIFYIYSFKFIKSYEVALFTIFTPLYISLIYNLEKRKFDKKIILFSLISIFGAGIVVFSEINSTGFIKGFILLQFSNICFAWGQLKYRKIMRYQEKIKDHEIFGYMYLGAFLLTFISFLLLGNKSDLMLNSTQALTLLYLGIVASGLAFFLWNIGAKITKVGTLSIFNNVKIPLAIAVSLLIFNESGNITQLVIGGIILIAILILSEKSHFVNYPE